MSIRIAENTFCTHETVHGEDVLCYRNPKIDVAILPGGTTADEFGNISLEQEPMMLGVRTLAMAARALRRKGDCPGEAPGQARQH